MILEEAVNINSKEIIAGGVQIIISFEFLVTAPSKITLLGNSLRPAGFYFAGFIY